MFRIFVTCLCLSLSLASGVALAEEHAPGSAPSRTEAPAPTCHPIRRWDEPWVGDFSTNWPTEITGSDRARAFVDSRKEKVEVPYTIETVYSSKYPLLPQDRIPVELREAATSTTRSGEGELQNFLLLGPPAWGISATGRLAGRADWYTGDKPVAAGRLHLVPKLSSKLLKQFPDEKMRPLIVFSSHDTFKEIDAATSTALKPRTVFAAPVFSEGIEHARVPADIAARSLYVPGYSFLRAGTDDTTTHRDWSPSGHYLLGAALTNAQAVASKISDDEIWEWGRLTGNRETVATTASGIPLLNAYRWTRVMARVAEKCASEKDPSACSRALREKESERARLMDFREEAAEKLERASRKLADSAATCEDKRKAADELREAMLLDPSLAAPRGALAKLYGSQGHKRAQNFLERGQDISPFIGEELEHWANREYETYFRSTLARTIRNRKINLADSIAKASQSTNPQRRAGALLASVSLDEASAVAVLKGFVERKDGAALQRTWDLVATEAGQKQHEAKLAHFVPLLEQALKDFDGEPNAGNPFSSTIRALATIARASLNKETTLSDEQFRHLIDTLTHYALRAKKEGDRSDTFWALATVNYPELPDDKKRYWMRSLRMVLRATDQHIIAKYAADYLARAGEKKADLLAIVAERAQAVPALRQTLQDLKSQGWGK